jgi:murein DD-endopeptidase MepM/ murein hydrolase activator NlpD
MFCIISSSQAIALTSICGDFKQGEILRGHTDDQTQIRFNDEPFSIDDAGDFLLVVERDTPAHTDLCFINADQTQKIYQLNIEKNSWDIQRINGVEQRKVTPSAQDDAEILRERQDVHRALTHLDMSRKDWKKGFILPVDGRISGHFGNQRIFNGIPKSPHTGTDIAAAESTPVKASADGVVVLSGSGYFYGGNMVILDHGFGLQTIYMHLSSRAVRIGDTVKQGDLIGKVGHTGRATGPHLHWGASLNNIRFRPHALLDLNRQTCRNVDSLIGERP